MGGVYTQLPDGLDEVDVIIAGGGTTGCVVASRLSDARPDLSILVVERGRNNLNDPTVTEPLYFVQHILDLPEPSTGMIHYKGRQEKEGVPATVVPAGSILGGGSSINMLTYTRGQREDLEWGMPGWSAETMLPYMKKLETYHGPGSMKTHGYEGPIHISAGPCGPTQLQSQFIEAAAKLGIRESLDLQDLDSNQGLQRNLRYISPGGKRQDAAHAYLHPRLQDGKHPNLHILSAHEVNKVCFDGMRATGVEITATSAGDKTTTIKARKMVVVSAGTLGTPLLLERSGVGSKKILSRAKIEPVADVPGVGADFQDHNTMLTSYYTSLKPEETWDDLLNGEATYESLIKEESKLMAWNGAEVTSKIRPTETEIEEILGTDTDARKLWDRDFKDFPNRPIATISTANGFIAPIADKNDRYFSTGNFLLYPYARGHVHLAGPGPHHHHGDIDLQSGILGDAAGFDLAVAMWLYKKQREIVRRLPVYRGEVEMLHPPFDPTSEATCRRRDEPLPVEVENIKYTKADDEVLEAWVRKSLAQNWHGSGTCKMATPEKSGVVDEKLRVYGLEALRIADLSIVPNNVGANTANMAFTIGEMAADILAADLKL